MGWAVAGRLGHVVIVLFFVSLATFSLVRLAPGNPALTILGNSATPKAIRQVDASLGLNSSFIDQYGHWLWQALHGNLGVSLVPPGGTVASRIAQAFPISIELTILAELVALFVSVPLAIASAVREGGWFDALVSGTSFAMLSIPTFLAGVVLALFLCVDLHVFPRVGWVGISQNIPQNLWHAILPSIVLAIPVIAIYIRVLRNEYVGTLRRDYILVARSKGLSRRYILWRHALRPSLFSLMTIWGVTFGALLGGTAIVEVIFSLPGLGSELVTAVGSSDYPMVQGIVLVIATVYVVMSIVVDFLYGVVNPAVGAQ